MEPTKGSPGYLLHQNGFLSVAKLSARSFALTPKPTTGFEAKEVCGLVQKAGLPDSHLPYLLELASELISSLPLQELNDWGCI